MFKVLDLGSGLNFAQNLAKNPGNLLYVMSGHYHKVVWNLPWDESQASK